jgi:rhodanese-related sulfurtransferase
MQTDGAKRESPVTRVVFEGLVVGIAGLLVALAANALSPRGLVLTRNYFPETAVVRDLVTGAAPARGTSNPAADAASAQSPAAQRLVANGLQPINGDTAARLANDPRCQQQLIVFIDARDEEHFLAGHVPGAFEFDRYHPEKYLMDVLSVCQTAEQIVVYCNGGDCEDSQYAAITLRDAGVANQKLMVYLGGIKEWEARGLPVEIGQRQSGKLRGATK